MRALYRLVVPAVLLAGGCQVGTSAKGYAPATGPAGAMVTIELGSGERVEGELLAVEDTALLVLRQGALIRMPIGAIVSGKAPKVSFNRQNLTERTRERLRLISRYPQGVSAELEARLLEVYRVAAVQEVT
jgi:hypothetical protein